MVRSALASEHRIAELRHLEGSPLAALAHNHDALRTPLVDLAEWHLLSLVMFIEVLHNLHYCWPPLLSPLGEIQSLVRFACGGSEANWMDWTASEVSLFPTRPFAPVIACPKPTLWLGVRAMPSEQIYTTLNKQWQRELAPRIPLS